MPPATLDSAPRRAHLAYLIASISYGMLAMAVCVPSMQEWGALLGADQASVQLTFSGFVMAYGSMQLFYGPLSDRLGRKPVLLFGMAIAVVGALLAALSTTVGALTLARVLQGGGCAAGMVVGRAMVQDMFVGPTRTQAMAYIGMAMGMSPPLASILGGQLHVHMGWQANFYLMALAGIGMVILGWRLLPDRLMAATQSSHWLASMVQAYAQLFAHRRFVLYVLVLAMTTAAFYAFLAGAPIVLKEYGVGPQGIGFYIMCVPLAYMLGNYLSSRWAGHDSDLRLMGWGQGASVLGTLLVLALAVFGPKSPLALTLPLILLGLGHGLLVPPTLAGTVSAIPALAGAAAAVAGLMQQVSGAGSGYAIGLMHYGSAINMGLLMTATTLVAALAMLALVAGRRKAA